ncbi:MAG: DUF6567 family protein [Smithellaceae bacterium]
MKKFFIVPLLCLLLAGCATSSGHMNEQTNTAVSLSKSNYKVVKAGAKGTSRGFYLLGFIPIFSPTYGGAKSDLYEGTNEKLEGRAIALANQTTDRSTLYLILFSIPKLTITADIVEFKDAEALSPPHK